VAFVLIVDASRGHAMRASEALVAAGHTCGWVTTAEQAIALLRSRVPDLILLDQAIPGADGGNLPQRLRRSVGASDLPIVLLTSGLTEPCVGHGDNAVLGEIRKPFDPGFLVSRAQDALDADATARAGARGRMVRSLA
jgi:DNA-binding response OmpR family regulator